MQPALRQKRLRLSMIIRICLTSIVLMLITLVVINLNGECDKDWKEWLVIFFLMNFLIMTVTSLTVIWA
jgi:hypothetical protein